MPGVQLSISAAARAMEGELIGIDNMFEGVNTDTRYIKEGQLFFALKGPNFDGHDFAVEAANQGAAALVVEEKQAVSAPQIIVEDALLALGQLSAAWRATLNIPVIAITGSNGKTTVKEMVAAIMSEQGNAFATKGNLNNEIGVPLSLLSVGTHHSTAIIEMGANHPREIAYLTSLARPNIALVNNAAAAHLEGFGSLEGVAEAKGEIYQGLCLGGYAIINADDDFAPLWKSKAKQFDVLTFGLENKADISCQWKNSNDGIAMDVHTPSGDFNCLLTLIGEHNILNALAAVAVAVAVNVPLEKIKAGLNNVKAVPGRLERKSGINHSLIIDDTYNANPNSTLAAIKVLNSMSGSKYLVLGDMGELGDESEQLHKKVGQQAKEIGIDKLYVIGELTKFTALEFGAGAMHFSTQADLVVALKSELSKKIVVLIKGSRAMKMDKVVDACVIENTLKGDH